MTIRGVDTSNHQGSVDYNAVAHSGYDFAVIKASEGTVFTDPLMAADRNAARAAGLIVGMYHFAGSSYYKQLYDPTAEADFFLSRVGALHPGEFLVLDFEPYGQNTGSWDLVQWCKTWLDHVAARTGINPLIYMDPSNTRGHDWTPIAATYGLWYASYNGDPVTVPQVPYWGSPAMHQYYDQQTVPGVPGPVDADVFYGTRDQLLAYGFGGTPPSPVPADVQEFLMALTDAQQLEVYNILKLIGTQILGQTYLADGQWGWPTDDGKRTTVVDMVRGLYPPAQKIPTVGLDESKLAAALLADPASVDALGKAIAAHLKLAAG